MADASGDHIDVLCSADGNFTISPTGDIEPVDSSEPHAQEADGAEPTMNAGGKVAHAQTHRPWVGIQFACCGVYRRVYREAHESWYIGRCPFCGREARLRVAPHGISSRFFVATPL